MTTEGVFFERGRSGSALADEVIIDAHMHIDRFYNFFIPRPDPPDLIKSARRLGIRRMYGSSLVAIRGDAAAGNNNAILLAEEYPDMFGAYLVVKPDYPEETEQVIALAERKRIRQFKIHDDGNDLPYDHPNYTSFYEWADSNGAIVLAHTYGRKQVIPMMGIASRFPGISILLAHSGIIDEEIYAEAVRKHENIFLETCNSMAWYGLVERLVAMAGADRVLFGTDMPFMSPDQQIGRILFARLSDDDKRKILGLNARALFAAR